MRDAACPLHETVLRHEHALFGNPDEMTAEQIARGEGGGLIALTRKSRDVSEKNTVLLRWLIAIAVGSLFGNAIPWKLVGQFVGKALLP
jgi:hypothetical protein